MSKNNAIRQETLFLKVRRERMFPFKPASAKLYSKILKPSITLLNYFQESKNFWKERAGNSEVSAGIKSFDRLNCRSFDYVIILI